MPQPLLAVDALQWYEASMHCHKHVPSPIIADMHLCGYIRFAYTHCNMPAGPTCQTLTILQHKAHRRPTPPPAWPTACASTNWLKTPAKASLCTSARHHMCWQLNLPWRLLLHACASKKSTRCKRWPHPQSPQKCSNYPGDTHPGERHQGSDTLVLQRKILPC